MLICLGFRYLNILTSLLIDYFFCLFINRTQVKKYYFYNENNQLIKQIDSTGWYLQKYSESKPSLQSIKTFEYRNENLRKTIEIKDKSTYISEYNEKGNLVNKCLLIDGKTDYCKKYNYVYQNGLLKELQTLPDRKTIFEYNIDGLPIEKREYVSEKLTSLIKYYYEKENTTHNKTY